MKWTDRVANNGASHKLFVPKIWCTLQCLAIMVVALFTFGLWFLLEAQSHTEFQLAYNDLCKQQYEGESLAFAEGQDWAAGWCTLDFTPDVDLVNPKLYYRLDNFYANHRTFIKSHDRKQLDGVVRTRDEISKCKPVYSVQDLLDWYSTDDLPAEVVRTDQSALADVVANPCGNIAKYRFTD